MSGKCDNCDKRTTFGCNVSHSKRHTNRPWRPNIQRVHMTSASGKPIRNICTRCLRTMAKTS